MKKSMIACLSALLALAVFADEPAAPAPEGALAPAAEKGPRGDHMRRPHQPPLMIQVTDKTTPEEIEAFKKQVVEKIDQSVADYKAKPAAEGREKPALQLGLMVMQRRAGMGPGMRGGKDRGKDHAMKGRRGERPAEAKGDMPPPEAPAEEK